MTAQPTAADMRTIDELAASIGITDNPAPKLRGPAPSRASLIATLEESRNIVEALIAMGGTAASELNAELAASVAENTKQIAALTAKIDVLLMQHGLNKGGVNA